MPELFYVIIAASVLLVIIIWLGCTARELSRKHNDLSLADKQMALYTLLHAKAREGPEAQRTLEQLQLSQSIYQNLAVEYNHCIVQPQNRIIAYFLGYAPAPEVNIE